MGNNVDKSDSRATSASGGAVQATGLRLVLDKVPGIFWTTDRELRITRTAGSGLRTFGVNAGEVDGRTLYEFLGGGARPEDGAGPPPVLAHLAALRGEPRDYEVEYSGRVLAARVEPLRDEANGPVIGVVGIAVDVTEHRHAERAAHQRALELREARKLEPLARQQRLRIVELTEVLAGVVSASERLVSSTPPGSVSADLDRIGSAAARGAELLRELRSATSADESGRENTREARGSESEGGETILLVDDEPQVRGFVRRALEEYGYRVLETSAVDEALSLGASHPGRIHLLLTDVVLPGMTGPQLAARLAPLRPEMHILYMTGYADDAVVHRGVIAAGQALLVKPFTSLGLAHEVRKALRP